METVCKHTTRETAKDAKWEAKSAQSVPDWQRPIKAPRKTL